MCPASSSSLESRGKHVKLFCMSSVCLCYDGRGVQKLNLQTFNALPACEFNNIASLVGRFYEGSALNV